MSYGKLIGLINPTVAGTDPGIARGEGGWGGGGGGGGKALGVSIIKMRQL